jgi:predicted transcriptional regulator
MSDKRKDARLTFRLTEDEQRRLATLAEREGVKPSVLIRRAITNLLRHRAA